MRIAALLKPIPVLGPVAPEQARDARRDAITINPFCRRAVAQACELAAAVGDGTVTVVALGPPSTRDLVRAAMLAAEDTDVVCDGLMLDDPVFAGSDTLATARALAAALETAGPFDLVLTGARGVDTDAGAVGPQVAQLLGLPFVGGARYLSLQRSRLHVRCEHDDGWLQVDAELPAVVSCAERLISPAPTGPLLAPANRVRSVRAADLGPGPWGAAASPTGTDDPRPRAVDRVPAVLDGDLDDQVGDAVTRLRERGALDDDDPAGVPPAEGERGVPIAVLVEPDRPSTSRELLGAAAQLALEVDGHVVALAITVPEPETLASWGADALVHLTGVAVAEDTADGVAAWARLASPWAILAPATAFGREVAARAAARLDAGLLSEALALRVEGGRLAAATPTDAGQRVVTSVATTPLVLATVRPGALARRVPRAAGRPEIRTMAGSTGSRLLVRSRSRDDDLEALARTRTVIGVGLEVGPDEYPLLAPLARALRAELAGTRPVADRGWLPRSRQIGLTGRSLAPRLYVALGQRGAFEHLVGVCAAGTVLAVDAAPGGPLLQHADVGIIGDWREVVPRLVEALAAVGVGVGAER